jgi:hypothetical protein
VVLSFERPLERRLWLKEIKRIGFLVFIVSLDNFFTKGTSESQGCGLLDSLNLFETIISDKNVMLMRTVHVIVTKEDVFQRMVRNGGIPEVDSRSNAKIEDVLKVQHDYVQIVEGKFKSLAEQQHNKQLKLYGPINQLNPESSVQTFAQIVGSQFPNQEGNTFSAGLYC